MRGSRKRDRRPPSRLWNCGTRPAKLHRWRAILMAFNTPFAICASSDSMTWTTSDGRHDSASTRRAPSTAWPCTSDLLPITPYCMWQRVHASGPINCLALHVRPSAGYFCGYCYGPYGRLAACPRVGPRQLLGPARPTFCRSLRTACGSASTRRAPSTAWPYTSDLLPVTSAGIATARMAAWQRVHVSGPVNCSALHVRPSAGHSCYPRSSGRLVVTPVSRVPPSWIRSLRCQKH